MEEKRFDLGEAREVLGGYGEWRLLPLLFNVAWDARQENRELTEEESRLVQMLSLVHHIIESQMKHLSSLADEPIQDIKDMAEEDEKALMDHLIIDDQDECIAARAHLVRLHKPEPDDLPEEESEAWVDNQRREFVAFAEITVAEALDYLDYWEQEREVTEAMQWFGDYWQGHREIAELTGDKPPETVGEFGDYLQRRADEEKEENHD